MLTEWTNWIWTDARVKSSLHQRMDSVTNSFYPSSVRFYLISHTDTHPHSIRPHTLAHTKDDVAFSFCFILVLGCVSIVGGRFLGRGEGSEPNGWWREQSECEWEMKGVQCVYALCEIMFLQPPFHLWNWKESSHHLNSSSMSSALLLLAS